MTRGNRSRRMDYSELVQNLIILGGLFNAAIRLFDSSVIAICGYSLRAYRPNRECDEPGA